MFCVFCEVCFPTKLQIFTKIQKFCNFVSFCIFVGFLTYKNALKLIKSPQRKPFLADYYLPIHPSLKLRNGGKIAGFLSCKSIIAGYFKMVKRMHKAQLFWILNLV